MWQPSCRFFTTYDEAYELFERLAPDLGDRNNEAIQEIAPKYKGYDHPSYTVLEIRRQLGGYHEEAPNRAKRPEAVLIARILLE
jgi:hypothetical protein